MLWENGANARLRRRLRNVGMRSGVRPDRSCSSHVAQSLDKVVVDAKSVEAASVETRMQRQTWEYLLWRSRCMGRLVNFKTTTSKRLKVYYLD